MQRFRFLLFVLLSTLSLILAVASILRICRDQLTFRNCLTSWPREGSKFPSLFSIMPTVNATRVLKTTATKTSRTSSSDAHIEWSVHPASFVAPHEATPTVYSSSPRKGRSGTQQNGHNHLMERGESKATRQTCKAEGANGDEDDRCPWAMM
ncbi:hypothetical protein D9758_014870 [Tetrapyrgos nigripes]|uniref:Secreted protein n=1 Tax=Tetrapyrgos nigripes TaxID=182062 RepID=A0A8H5FT29_9AGAR|nr:hypothetical protein D9758_014870 [Tetrapyrgos nigripes]